MKCPTMQPYDSTLGYRDCLKKWQVSHINIIMQLQLQHDSALVYAAIIQCIIINVYYLRCSLIKALNFSFMITSRSLKGCLLSLGVLGMPKARFTLGYLNSTF